LKYEFNLKLNEKQFQEKGEKELIELIQELNEKLK
jgi:hypothetical protein